MGLAVFYLFSTQPNTVTIPDLYPETQYQICGYLETEFKLFTANPFCLNFSTKATSNIYILKVDFSSPPSA